MTTYADFLLSKTRTANDCGGELLLESVSHHLFGWQAELVIWAVAKGRAALFADTGLGKTRMQLEWARLSAMEGRALLLAPLAVCQQTVREANSIGVFAAYAHDQAEADANRAAVTVTNYERVHLFDASEYRAVVLDESSILKAVDGSTRRMLTETFAATPYKLACTATPAPNDVAELTNHAEWLGVSSRAEMLSAYFVNDEKLWRLKGHAANAMWSWMSSWAVAVRSPADLGWPDQDYQLAGLEIVPHHLHVALDTGDQLFATDLGGVGGRAKVRRQSLAARVGRAVELVTAEATEPWIVWCGLNDESSAVTSALANTPGGVVNVEGNMTPEAKAEGVLAFVEGRARVLVTKPSVAGFGLNFQHCARMAFVGLSDSYEAYYQCIRRCYRYGQTRPVIAHVVLSELEGQIAANVARKEREAHTTMTALITHTRARWLKDAA